MEGNPSELVASNQQNKNQNSGQYVSFNISQRMFKTNRGLLQHLSFCRRRNREYVNSDTVINDSNNIAADNDNSDCHDSNGNGITKPTFGMRYSIWNSI